jgi:hypothetical protein
MNMHMPDSALNEAERGLQHSFMKSRFFNGLLMAVAVLAAYLPMWGLPDRRQFPPRTIALNFQPVALPVTRSPLRLAGAWVMTADDRRFGGLSALAVDGKRFVAVSDLGAVLNFDPPSAAHPLVLLTDLVEGPGPVGRKTSRDAESLARDPGGRGWWVGYEQRHSLWLYDRGFRHALAAIRIDRPEWWPNRGIEGLVADGDGLLALAENGREAIMVRADGQVVAGLEAGAEIADAARALDGSTWLLLRSKGLDGIRQEIAPLVGSADGYRIGPKWPLPKAALDNYEGMAIARRPGGGLRFWLVSDDGHRLKARTLLVALDLLPDKRKRPAESAGR